MKEARPLFVEGGQMGSTAVRLCVISNVFETTKKDQTIFCQKKHPQPIRVENEFLTLSVRAYSKKVTNEDAVYNRTHTFVSENGYGYPTPGTTDTPTRQISCMNV